MPLFAFFEPKISLGRPRQGLNRVARKGGGEWPARRGGDLGSHRKPAGPTPGNRGQPVKARSRPKNSCTMKLRLFAWNAGQGKGRKAELLQFAQQNRQQSGAAHARGRPVVQGDDGSGF